MGEIADDLIDRMFDDDFGYPSSRDMRGSHYNVRQKKQRHKLEDKTFDEATRAAEFPSKKTDPSLLRDYPEKTFDMSFFPTVKREPVVEDPWAIDPDEEAPF